MSVTGIENGVEASSRVYTSNGNQLNIILSENTEKGSVEVLDLTGRVVFVSSLNTNRTAFQVNVASGIYIVKLESDKGASTHKIHLN